MCTAESPAVAKELHANGADYVVLPRQLGVHDVLQKIDAGTLAA